MLLNWNVLEYIEQKKLVWLIRNPKALVKYNLTKALNEVNQINYLYFFYCNKRLVSLILKKTKIFGIGSPSYYNLGLSKWQKSSSMTKYQLKLNSWKDSWFFFGIVLRTKWNFLNSSLIVRNVFYNEIIEKSFFLFNIRNVLSQSNNVFDTKQIFFKKTIKKKTTLYNIRSCPRAYSKITII
jgi:ribosomal protein L19